MSWDDIQDDTHDDVPDYVPKLDPREDFEIEFTAKNNDDAKRKVLNFAKQFIKNLPKPANKGEYFTHVIAHPVNNEVRGPKLLRLRHGFDNRRILKVKDPNIALVQGYGPKQWDETTGQHTVRKTS